ncbi:TIGR03986 family CRISPR-associated RAMP protein [Saccharopolyspora griseoalba]|uniref:TIGR03986 family CRISPR-associated RAMP protein n=1 Tax=Saccharopolyspora griseoalba TaxID=1431848 RepID=A0ABW2LP01_9PSEU
MSEAGQKFVNPYTFVPFPESAPARTRPTTHIANPELLCGKLTVDVKVETAVAVHGFMTGQVHDLPVNGDGKVIIPGSSLKGAIRSLHETITGSCLRVFDGDFVPGYRDPVEEKSIARLRMAIVETPADPAKSTPPTVRLCPEPKGNEPRKLPKERLFEVTQRNRLVKSGDRLDLDIDHGTGQARSACYAADGEWVVFISDAGTRKGHAYYAQVRRYPPKDTPPLQVPESTWERYLHALRGSRDTSGTEQARDDYATVVLRKTEEEIGRRHLANETLVEGQPVWVELGPDNEIKSVRLAMVWRHSGAHPDPERQGSAKDRVAEGFLACTDWTHLCPSCQVFGSADTSSNNTPTARQNSYRGHVRFLDAVAEGEVKPIKLRRAPMGSPRPGAGQFYLVNGKGVEGEVGDPPLREWGSRADRTAGGPRRLRGRKFYWHTPSPESAPQPRRASKRKHQSSELSAEIRTIPRGTVLTTTLVLDNLTEFQLGGLLAALQPNELLTPEKGKIWQHIGGGKPLGLGACSLTVDEDTSWIERVGSRYGHPTPATPIQVKPLIDKFRETMRTERRHVCDTWGSLAKALGSETVDRDRVWYPPGPGWQPNATPSKEAEEGFAFWDETSGSSLRPRKPLRSLPHIDADDQTMTVRKPKNQQGNQGGASKRKGQS